ncbi:hypothetical protein KEM48_010817 [Puccinia striiformis f. sp. tritici PST-130]|nr:hypothetical protein KEM48_010817 [Puccinia striiformis f. sp. tritici PST-130]
MKAVVRTNQRPYWEPRENVKPRFYIPSEPSSALLNGANITEDSCHIAEEDGYASSDWEPRENVKPRFYIPSKPSSALLDGANITEDSCHIAEEDRYASSDWEPRENVKPRFYIPSEPSSALINGTNIADNKRHHKLDSDMEPHILKKQCVSPTQGGTTAGPSTIRLVPPAPSSPRPITGANSNRLPSRDVDAVNQTRYPCQDCGINYPSEERLANHLTKSSHKEKVESNNSKGKARG